MDAESKLGEVARAGAATLLGAVIAEQVMLRDGVRRLAHLSPPEVARATSLASLVLRQMAALDGVLDQFMDRRPPLKVQNVCRICAAEVLIEGIASHGAVNGAVSIVKRDRKNARFSGLVNAVCRKLTGQTLPVTAPQPLPKAIRGALIGAYGHDVTEAIEAAHSLRPPVDLTVKSDPKAWAEKLDGTVLPNGSVRVQPGTQLSALPGFEDGDWWVQDAAAAVPVTLLGDVGGKRVLDLCAAPGGKTMQLAAAGAQVTALDVAADRMERVAENLARTKLQAEMVVADALNWEPDAPFDTILLDAPCSATGTIRRHPDLPFVRPSLDLKPLLDLQAALIDRAAGWLTPGGMLVYSVCSLIPVEGERQIDRALSRGVLQPADAPCLDPAWKINSHSLRLRPDFWPDLGGMDGFFAALLQKPAKKPDVDTESRAA